MTGILILVKESRLLGLRDTDLPLKWKYEDLRVLDEAFDELDSQDLLAVYARQLDDRHVIFRIDLPGGEPPPDSVLQIAIEYPSLSSQQTDWNYILTIPTSGPASLSSPYFPDQSSAFWVSRNYRSGKIQAGISFPENIIASHARIQAIILDSQGKVYDLSVAFSLAASPPPKVQAVPVLWNLFPAATPAQALRSWDGAHSGRDSERHGLRYLLQAIASSNINFLWLRQWDYRDLAMLDYMDVDDGFVGRCLLGFGCVVDYGYAQLTAKENWITNFDSLADLKHQLFRKKAFAPLLVGGDFQNSKLGSLDARDYLKVLESQSWLDIRTDKKLLRNLLFPTFDLASCLPYSIDNGTVWCKEEMAMRNISAHLKTSTPIAVARQQFSMTLSNPNDLIPAELRNAYLQFDETLSMAEQWAKAPATFQSCSETTCLLSSPQIFASFSQQGGYLSALFVRLSTGVHQIIGPTYQLAASRSDPLLWHLEQGVLADPMQSPGAFYSPADHTTYQSIIEPQRLVLFDPISGVRRIYSLDESTLQLQFSMEANADFDLTIPLILDPWTMLQTGWGDLYFKTINHDSVTWGVQHNVEVDIKTTGADGRFIAFIDSRDLLQLPEDPNFPYPEGHYLPAPLAQMNLTCPGECTVSLTFRGP